MVIFNSNVKLPEGITHIFSGFPWSISEKHTFHYAFHCISYGFAREKKARQYYRQPYIH